MNLKYLKQQDNNLYQLIQKEAKRQTEGLEMIPSENYVSSAVLEAMGSILTNKYSEGYPGRRYYGGNSVIDEIENLAIERTKALFNVPYVNVQPYSGSPANQAVYFALLEPSDTIMGMNLPDGGHLTHGWHVSFSGKTYKSILYHTREDGKVDFEEIERLTKEHKPKLVWIGASAYTKEFEFEEFAKIIDKTDAYLAADIAHVAGLIIAGVHKRPEEFVHIITTTMHKTLRGPRGAIIMVTEKGLKKDPELGKKIDKAVFPGLQGGPHNHTTAGIAVALKEAATPEFKEYGRQIVKNAKVLAETLKSGGLKLVGDGTENHLILVDLIPTNGIGAGTLVEYALEVAGITVNKNPIPNDRSTPYYPSGIRLGTPALTSRGMKEPEMEQIGKWIAKVAKEISEYRLPEVREEKAEFVKRFKKETDKNKALHEIKTEVKNFCKDFPVPGIDNF